MEVLYVLTPFICHPALPAPYPSGKLQFFLFICVSLILSWFICSFLKISHISEIMSYVFLWLISFSIIPSRSSHVVVTNGKISVFFNGWVQFSSVAQSCPTLCDPMNRSMPGLPVHHQLPELTQTHVCWVSDAIQPSYPLSSPSPPALNLSQHQGLFQSSHQVAKVLDL